MKEYPKCAYCGKNIITRNATKFCSHKCRAAYMSREADKKRFKPCPNFKQLAARWDKPLRIVLSRNWEYACNAYDIDDFRQICLISLWKLASNHPEKTEAECVSYVMKTFELAIKEYCRENGKNNHGLLGEDPIFFANPERIAESREYISRIKGSEFKHLLMYSLGDMSANEMAKRLGIGKKCIQWRIWNERNVLNKLIGYDE